MAGSRPPIGMKIKRARERLRMTQAQLAAALGVTQKTIDNWEHDKRYPKSAIGALEDVLGISLDEAPERPEELVPQDEWEAEVLSDPDLPDRIKRQLVSDSRAARAAYAALRPEQHAGRATDPQAS